ncbi:MAG: imidazolonepropionase [Bacilli bacterium]|nr:imidazolonepropionase [Bacilli bacterium]
MHADVVVYNIGTLLTPNQVPPLKGFQMSKLLEIKNAYLAVKNGKILAFGSGDYSNYVAKRTHLYNAKGRILIPGLIDSHTHLIHAGSRENEFSQKIKGVPYLEILKQGGGILSTVNATRAASYLDLFTKAMKSIEEMLLFGVTTVEAKSGYGLNLETEIKQLEVAKELNNNQPVDIVSTYLGAHATPLEFKGNKKGYINELKHDMKIIKEKELAKFVDVFCEDSVFNLDESREILIAAKNEGFDLKIHADEIVSLGGGGLAVELEAKSADHLMAASEEDISRLANSNVVANLLPSTSFYLNKDYAKARRMIDAGCAISISSDYNPGSSPSENLQFSMQLAANKLRMTPNEILNAVTINAAYNLGIDQNTGSIEVGKQADFVIMDSTNLDYIFYHFGINHTNDVFKDGILVVKDKTLY